MVDKNRPSPDPAIHLPTNSIGRFSAALAMTEPIPKMRPPRAKVRVREMRSESGPAMREAMEAVMSMEETMRPWRVAEEELNLAWN